MCILIFCKWLPVCVTVTVKFFTSTIHPQRDGVIDHSVGKYRRRLQLSWIRMTDTLNARFTYCLYYKIFVCYRRCIEIYSGAQYDFLSKDSAWIRRIDTRGAL